MTNKLKSKKVKIIVGLLLILVLPIQAQNNSEALSETEMSIAKIAALTAKGDLEKLKDALNDALDNGLTVNKVKEELVHLYAYCGFPRSLMAINTLTEVLETRKQNGIEDEVGEIPEDLKEGNKYEIGKQVLAELTGVTDRPTAGYAKTAPIIEVFLKEHLFADIFKRGVLSFKEREIATISALLTMGDLAPMATGHMRIGMRLGLTDSGINQILDYIETGVDENVAHNGRGLHAALISGEPYEAQKESKLAIGNKIYPRGEKIEASVFTGNAYLTSLVTADEDNKNAVGVVTFEAGARTFWHQHPDGQIILAISGVGYTQTKGSTKQILRKGDVAKCPPNTPHWHGAGPDKEFVQIAITSRNGGSTKWMDAVSDEEYNRVD